MTIQYNTRSNVYHSFLRVSVLILAVALVFESGVVSTVTRSITHTAGQQFATALQATLDSATYDEAVSVGEGLSSHPNDIGVRSSTVLSKSTFILSSLVFIILLLIILNYILHHLRMRERVVYLSRK